MTTSQICRTTHMQNCQSCEDLECGDNQNLRLQEVVRLRKENKELKTRLRLYE